MTFFKGSSGLGFLYDSSWQVELTAMKELCVTGPVPNTAPKVEAVLTTFKVRLNDTLLHYIKHKYI
jgi:hypothetical protein